MTQKRIVYFIVGIAVLVGGFFLLNNYIYTEKQGEELDAPNDTPITMSEEGTIVSINTDQAAFDGPFLITIKTKTGATSVIALPSMGLPLCPAYQKGSILDIALMKVGDRILVRGASSVPGSVIPCESEDHYIRIAQ